MQRLPDTGVNEVVASILMVVLLIALAAIIGGIVLGVIVIQPKSAYIPPEVRVVSGAGGQSQAISLYSRGGDAAALDSQGGSSYALGIYVDTPSQSYTAMPDPGIRTFGPGETLYVYNSGSGYRITDNMSKVSGSLPPGALTLRIVDENAKLLVYKEGLTIGGGVTVSPTPACTLGTGWRIWNRDTVAHSYILKVQPSGPIISQGSVPPQTRRFVWYSKLPSYQANLTTSENGDWQVRGSGQQTCQFSMYDVSFTDPKIFSTLDLNAM